MLGAIIWNLITWWLGLPSSSSHALIGGLVGAALAQSGETGVHWHGIVHKVVIPALWAPTIAFAGAFLLLLAIYWVFQWMTPGLANRVVPARAARLRHLGRRSRTARTTRRRRWA